MSTAGKGVKLKALAEAPETLITEAILTGGIDKLLEGFEEEKRLEQEKLDEQAVVNAKKVYATFTEDEVEVDRIYYPDRSRLIEYLYLHTGRLIPYKAMCPGHNAPAEFIEHILYGETDVLALANRSGGKTMQLGMACGMLVYPFSDRPHGIKTRQLGGSSDQSKKIYEEFQNFLENGYYDKVIGDVLQAKTMFEGGGRIELLTQSTRSVRGPHVPRLLLDEIDEFDRPVYNASLLIPQSTVDVKSMIAMASTRHRTYGLMREVFETFKGKRLIWCVFEVMEACTGDYSCSTCNLATYCPGKEKMEHATGYLSVDDARNQRSRVKDDDIYEAEALCRKPRSEGAIYQRLDPALHLVDVAYNPLLPIHKAFDYGTDHPTVLQYFQIVKEEGRYQARCFDELRWRGTAPSVMVREMKAHDAKMGYSVAVHTFVPQDAAGLRAELEDKDIGTSYPKQSVDDGIATIRNLLVADTISKVVGIVWSRTRCRETFKELEMYHADGGKVVKKQDDGPDCSRYFCHSMPELQTMGKPVIAMTTETLID